MEGRLAKKGSKKGAKSKKAKMPGKAKKALSTKPSAKKTPAKKTAAKKKTAKKTAPKKTAAKNKKLAPKSPSRKAPAKKAAPKKASPKRATAKKSAPAGSSSRRARTRETSAATEVTAPALDESGEAYEDPADGDLPFLPVERTEHPKLAALLGAMPPGKYAGGTLVITEPRAHQNEMSRWLMGNVEGRVALGRTAFGDLVVFRDLRERAAEHGLAGAEYACDVAIIDLNLKRMTVIACSVEELLDRLPDTAFQRAFLRRDLYDEVRTRLGDVGEDETYAFVPALGLGGSETAASVQKSNWQVYQDILFQV